MENLFYNNISIIKENHKKIHLDEIISKDVGLIHGFRTIAKNQNHHIDISHGNPINTDFVLCPQGLEFENTSNLRWIIHPHIIPTLCLPEIKTYDVQTNTILAIKVLQASEILTNLNSNGESGNEFGHTRTHILLISLAKLYWDSKENILYYLDKACAELFNVNISSY